MIDLPFIRRIRFWYFVSAFPFTSRYWLLHGSPRPCCPVFPSVYFPFLASGYLCLVPHLHDPGSFSSPYACVSLQLLSRCPLRYLQFFRFIRRGLCVHRRSSLSPISFRISVLTPRFRSLIEGRTGHQFENWASEVMAIHEGLRTGPGSPRKTYPDFDNSLVVTSTTIAPAVS
jgi:hypothetical protein